MTEFMKSQHQIIIEPKKGWQFIDWKELISYKDLLFFLVMRDIKVLYKQTILGFSWAIIRPFFSMIVFSIIFGNLAKIPSDGVPYPIFSYTALLPWIYFSTAMTSSTGSLVQSSGILNKVYFPRLFIPLTPVLANLLDFAIAFLILGLMMIWFGIAPTHNIIVLPLLILLMVSTAAGMGMWLSALGIQYRDVKYAVQFLSQVLMYGAPVVWPVSLIPDQYRLWYGLYPMGGVIEGFRSALLGSTPMPWDLILMGCFSSALIFFTGIIYFRQMERIFSDVA